MWLFWKIGRLSYNCEKSHYEKGNYKKDFENKKSDFCSKTYVSSVSTSHSINSIVSITSNSTVLSRSWSGRKYFKSSAKNLNFSKFHTRGFTDKTVWNLTHVKLVPSVFGLRNTYRLISRCSQIISFSTAPCSKAEMVSKRVLSGISAYFVEIRC